MVKLHKVWIVIGLCCGSLQFCTPFNYVTCILAVLGISAGSFFSQRLKNNTFNIILKMFFEKLIRKEFKSASAIIGEYILLYNLQNSISSENYLFNSPIISV